MDLSGLEPQRAWGNTGATRPAENRRNPRSKKPVRAAESGCFSQLDLSQPNLKQPSLNPKVEGSNPSRPISERPAMQRFRPETGGPRTTRIGQGGNRRGNTSVEEGGKRARVIRGRDPSRSRRSAGGDSPCPCPRVRLRLELQAGGRARRGAMLSLDVCVPPVAVSDRGAASLSGYLPHPAPPPRLHAAGRFGFASSLP